MASGKSIALNSSGWKTYENASIFNNTILYRNDNGITTIVLDNMSLVNTLGRNSGMVELFVLPDYYRFHVPFGRWFYVPLAAGNYGYNLHLVVKDSGNVCIRNNTDIDFPVGYSFGGIISFPTSL